MDMVISAGKSRKNVDAYVILPPGAKQAIYLMNATRDVTGIPQSNPYIFARLGLHSPERVTSTVLRRYIATVTREFFKTTYCVST